MEGVKNNRKYIELKKEDFERYKIPISLGNWLPKNRKKYIWGELEKRHPCFSDDFSFFSKEKLSKKGLYSDVFVVAKAKLGVIKSETSHKSLLLDGEKISVVNYPRNIIFISCLLLLISVLPGHIIREKFTDKLDQEGIENVVREEKIEEPVTYKKVDKKILDRFFLATMENKGSIRNIAWKLTKTGELLSGTVENLYPEVIENALNTVNINSTKYNGEIPFFDFLISNKFLLDGELINNEKVNTKVREDIRTILKEDKIEIIEETLNPYKIIINFPVEKQLNIEQNEKSSLSKLNDVLAENELYVNEFNISGGKNIKGEMKTRMELCISPSYIYENNVLRLLNDNLALIYNQKKIESVKIRNVTTKIINKDEIEKELGKVNYENGKKVLFYKNAEGKIKKRELF